MLTQTADLLLLPSVICTIVGVYTKVPIKPFRGCWNTFLSSFLEFLCLQCFDAVGWLTERASGLRKFLLQKFQRFIYGEPGDMLSVQFQPGQLKLRTRNILDCDQSYYSSLIVFFYIPKREVGSVVGLYMCVSVCVCVCVCDSAHLDSLLEYCNTGVQEGATLVYGGKRVDRRGYFMLLLL